METSLKESQLRAVHRLLSLQSSSSSSSDTTYDINDYTRAPAGSSHNEWKVLIYDKPCQSIISPLLTVSQLRSRGVTLHMLAESKREPIPDVPALYFLEPTRSNLSIIAQDCAKRLYSKVHLHFVSKLDRGLMEEFAKMIVASNSLDCIASVHDEYLDFVSLEHRLFALGNTKESYVSLHQRGVTDQTMDLYMDQIAHGLLSVVGCLGAVPVIRCPKGGAPDMIARKLSRLIASHPTHQKSFLSHTRPLLVLLDRNMDLITPLQHSITYQALIDDLLQHKANRVEFTEWKDNRTLNKKLDLDPDADVFYSQYKFAPVPEAIEANGTELQEVTSRENAIRSKATLTPNANDPIGAAPDDAASDLAHAVDSLPKLLEQKKKLEEHTSVLQAIMAQVGSRDVPQFYQLENDLATGQFKTDLAGAKSQVLEVVTDPSKGNVEDKVRLVVVYCLATTAPAADVSEVTQQMAEALETKGLVSEGSSAKNSGGTHGVLSKVDRSKLEKGLKAIQYLKNLRSMQMIPNIADLGESKVTGSSSNADMLSGFMTRATNQATGLLAAAADKVSSMVGKIHKYRTTRVVENLCEMKPNTEDDEYLYLDPKIKGEVDVKALRTMARAPVRQVITFVVGGGCYAEYQNLQMIANERRNISYGSTEILSPCDFLEQLGQLS